MSDWRVVPECSGFEVTFDDVDGNPHEASPCIFTSMESLHTISDIVELASGGLRSYHGDVHLTGIRELPNFLFIIEEITD